jgi:hypothetical protein
MKKISYLLAFLLAATSLEAQAFLYGPPIAGNGITVTGSIVGITAPVSIANGGSGQITANAALNAFLPSQTGESGKFLSTNGTSTSWVAETGVGTVTSVGYTGDGVIFNSTVTGSPVTASGTFVPSLLTQTATTVLAGPTTGSAATPTFRALSTTDIVGLGTMATQAANNVLISGGTIENATITGGTLDNTDVGDTIPANGTFSNLTVGGLTQLQGGLVVTFTGVTSGSTYNATPSDCIINVSKFIVSATSVVLSGISPAGQVVIIKDAKGVAAANPITITAAGFTNTIDGQSSYVINVNYGSVSLYNNGMGWSVF